MGVRLNKVLSELNIGLQTALDYLKAHAEVGVIKDDANPNTKISDEQYALLVQRYKGDRNVKKTANTIFKKKSLTEKNATSSHPNRDVMIKQETNSAEGGGSIFLPAKRWRLEVPFTDDPERNRSIINSLHWNEFRLDTFMFMPDGAILIPADQSKIEKYSFWSRQDITDKCLNAIKGGNIVKNQLSEPTKYIHIAPYVKDIPDRLDSAAMRKDSKPQKATINPSVIGKIDLDSLNVSTRTKKKTKEEKRQERESKQFKNIEPTLSTAKTQHSVTASNPNTIRDIWQRFVDIQEKLIRQRCAPISIDPESIEIEDDKLYVTVDESQHDKRIDSILRNDLRITEYDLDSGAIHVDDKVWDSMDESKLSYIRKSLSECYIELDTTPTINVTVEYASNMGRYDQMSLDELRQLEMLIKDGRLIEGTISDTAAFISKVSLLTNEYKKHLFGDHLIHREGKAKQGKEPTIVEVIEYKNQYLDWDVIQKNSQIGLSCKKYTLYFKINNETAKEALEDAFDCYFAESDSFVFKRKFNEESPFHKDFLAEINNYISDFIEEATIYCQQDDIECNVVFTYSVSNRLVRQYLLESVASYVSTKDGLSFNPDTRNIGIDFNWREQDIDKLINDIESDLQFVKVNIHDNHRFKCNVSTNLVGFEELKVQLEDKYEDIDVSNDVINHQISIRLPYVEANLYEIKANRLMADLDYLKSLGSKVTLTPRREGKVSLNIAYNGESRIEDLSDSIVEMRKADFGLMIGEREVPFGKLLRVNYPDLIFDIDVEDDKKDSIYDIFNAKAVNTIIPILTGDLEKISRLKNTFTMATTGAELLNPHLQRFIFDSSEANPISDINLILRQDGSVYNDICRNLLNAYVNESQKQAIIKAMYADDLAVIQGPPGTGKSTAIAELIWQLVRQGFKQGNKRERILLTSETNLAVDNAISRIVNAKTNLVKPIRFGGEEKLESEGLQFSIDLMKRWVEEGDDCLKVDEPDEENDSIIESNLILKNWLENISQRSFYRLEDEENEVMVRWRNYLRKPDKELRQIVYNRYIEGVNVIGATCSSIGDKKAEGGDKVLYTSFFHNYCEVFKQTRKSRAKIEFTTVIQDESSKATPAELVLPFVYGHRAVVIGDHRQLPPMLDKEEFEDTLDYAIRVSKEEKDRQEIAELRDFVDKNFAEMEISHFQRLYENIHPSLKGTFNLQYRMHPDINQVIEQFYRSDGGLRCGLIAPRDLGVNDPDMTNPFSRYHGIDIPGLIGHNTHVVFIDTKSPEMMDGTSRVNYGEIETVGKLLTRFEESSSFQRYLAKFTKEEDKQIGIISFYGKQIKHLRAVAKEHSNIPVRVSTVDRFQGMERNIVIVSMVRSNIIQSSKNQQPDKKRYGIEGYPKQVSLGFAQSPNRLNVALSRAKRLLIIVGNREHFSALEIYRRLFLTIESNINNKVISQNEV